MTQRCYDLKWVEGSRGRQLLTPQETEKHVALKLNDDDDDDDLSELNILCCGQLSTPGKARKENSILEKS